MGSILAEQLFFFVVDVEMAKYGLRMNLFSQWAYIIV